MNFNLNQFHPLVCTAMIFFSSQSALGQELRNPPTYFSMFRVNLTVALDVANNCETLEIDQDTYQSLTELQFQKLEQDGFSRENWRNEMNDIPVGLRDRPKMEFYFKWGVRTDDPDSYCHAGAMEIRGGTMIGELLTQTQQ